MSYEGIEIHQEMINDEERVDAYRKALSSISDEKVIIDVGAGTGILSMMAIDYGAQCVFAIEKSLIYKTAQENFS
jgi:predicted RNA methylase